MSNNTANTNTNNSSKPTSNNNETGYVKRRRRDSVSLHHKVTSPDETRGKDLSEAERVTGENEAMADIKILLDFMEEEAHKEGGGEGGAPAGGNSPVPLVDTSDSPFSPPGPRRRRETRKPTL
ncbi:hypothetical protein ADEAN_000706900 [Angomonas deanei]|uniref:Uncharacterized protein n=1 Tax=Angomonas deanei TaxID=59799 RepID=A0A7G2CI72_9TRYP|nr:hypothetical protein ADEAN_000706900 [Angomonas deanei]